ncbi:hypothetical protein [Ancylobacter sp. IITR112]|uniref:hypothetical protein n=1 Tax=Ancylobacter sp. IITR112 TaxID=3138073 RepID=UPI00352B8AC5
MLFPAVTLALILSVTFSLPSFLALLNHPQEAAEPALATLATAALAGSLLLLGTQIGWPSSAAVLVAAGVFDRFVYAPRSHLSRRVSSGAAFAFLLIGLTLGDWSVLLRH